MRVLWTLVAWGLGSGGAATALAAPVSTYFRVLVGYTEDGAQGAEEVSVLPGTVVRVNNARDTEDLLRLMEDLRQSYRLASLAPARSQMSFMERNVPVDVATVDGGPRVQATLATESAEQATYKLRLSEGGKTLAEPVIAVKRGGRAVVGTRDGPAAPYLFVVVEALPDKVEALGIEPTVIHKVTPKYPDAARKARIEGLVLLEVTVSAEGEVVSVSPIRDEPAGLTEAAIEAVRQWRYAPPVGPDGRPQEVKMVVTINFRLS